MLFKVQALLGFNFLYVIVGFVITDNDIGVLYSGIGDGSAVIFCARASRRRGSCF